MTSHASTQCFPLQKIQTGSFLSPLNQCFSLFGHTPPLFPGTSSTLCLFNHCWKLFIEASISQFSQFRWFAQYRASLAVVCWEWTSRTPEACRLRPLTATHRNFCSRSRKIPESSSNWILWRQEGSLFFLRARIHNKFALAILGSQSFPSYLLANFTRLYVCYLCSYVLIDHFQQIAEFLFCADRLILDLCNKHVSKSHPVGGRSFERCYYQFGQFCCGWMGIFLQFQLCASPLILHQFAPATYIARALLVANAAQLNGAPLLRSHKSHWRAFTPIVASEREFHSSTKCCNGIM